MTYTDEQKRAAIERCGLGYIYMTDSMDKNRTHVSEVLLHFLRAAEQALAEQGENFPGGQCPSCGFPKDDFDGPGYTGMKARAEARAEVEQLKTEASNQRILELTLKSDIAALQARLSAMEKVVGAAKKARAGGPYTPMFDALDALAELEK